MTSNHVICFCPFLLLPSIFPSIRVFSNESILLISWPKYWSFSFSTSLSNDYSGLISFRIHWLDILAMQVSLKSLLQHHSSRTSIFWLSAFLIIQLSHLYMTIGKTIALTIWSFVAKVMSLLFNILSSFLTTFPPRSKCLLIPWLQSSFSAILEPKKIKSLTLSIFYPSICHDLVAQMVKHLPTMQETWVQSLGWEDLLEKEMANHSSILAWKIPWMEEPGRLQSMGSQRVRYDWVTSHSHSFSMKWWDQIPWS